MITTDVLHYLEFGWLGSDQGLRLSKALRLWGWRLSWWWGLGPGEGGGEGEWVVAMCGGGEGGESLSRPDICMDKKYLAAACLSCSRSSAVCRLSQNIFIIQSNILHSQRQRPEQLSKTLFFHLIFSLPLLRANLADELRLRSFPKFCIKWIINTI